MAAPKVVFWDYHGALVASGPGAHRIDPAVAERVTIPGARHGVLAWLPQTMDHRALRY